MKSQLRIMAVTLVFLMMAASCATANGDETAVLQADGVELAAADGPIQIAASGGAATIDDAEVRRALSRVRSWWSRRKWRGSLPRWRRFQPRVDPTTTTVAVDPTSSSSTPDTSPTSVVEDTTTTTAGVRQTTTTQGTSTTRASSTTSQSTSTTRETTTTERQTTTTARQTTTQRQTTTTNSGGGGRFRTLPPGAALPSGAECAARVRPADEVRSMNNGYNSTRGTKPNGRYPRVDGDFVGTTDEIIQWAACKWGIDEDWARAQVAKESWWDMRVGGDQNADQNSCHPSLRTSGPTCPESIGLMQVRFLYHLEAFEDENAIRSSAYNIDYAYAVWRACYNGELKWLNNVERGATYQAGDLEGCLGVWFTGRWYVPRAYPYIDAVREYKNNRVWETSAFLNYR